VTQKNALEDMTPTQIVAELDRYIIGQTKAKRAVAIALRNRWRRLRLPEDLREEVIPKNILMIGPTGVGKTEIARRLAQMAHAPFLKVEATKFTEVGYVGRDVDAMVRDIVQVSLRLVEGEERVRVKQRADRAAIERVLDILRPRKSKVLQAATTATRTAEEKVGELAKRFGIKQSFLNSDADHDDDSADSNEQEAEIRRTLREELRKGARDEEEIEIETEDHPRLSILPMGGQNSNLPDDIVESLQNLFPKNKKKRRVTIGEARKLFSEEAVQLLLDRETMMRTAIERVEQTGIIFIDEIDKVAGRGKEGGSPDVSREGVQRDLLPLIEGSTVQTKWGSVRTHHILFICAGAFHVSRPSDLIPELQGRLPIRVEMDALTEAEFCRILTEPDASLTRQYTALLATEGITVEFREDAIAEIAKIAVSLNTRTENIGARRLHTMLEHLLEEISFDAPDRVIAKSGEWLTIDKKFVQTHLGAVAKDDDLSRYIL
jgi:ATP-dependent HslUV protease ATP-binding subunit HslU